MSPTVVRDVQEHTGAEVVNSTVWYRGRSATFSPQEVAQGKGDEWLAKQQEKGA